MRLEDAQAQCRIIAILRGLHPDDAVDVVGTLIDAGITLIEVPLNSPDPFRSIERAAAKFEGQALVGAGTVLSPDQCQKLKDAGGRLVVSPNCEPEVIKTSKALGLYSFPGVATPTEAFIALNAGADGIKLFPFETLGPAALKAWGAVLPAETLILPVGGVRHEDICDLAACGAGGFGIGSALFTPEISLQDLRTRAADFVAADRQACKGNDL